MDVELMAGAIETRWDDTDVEPGSNGAAQTINVRGQAIPLPWAAAILNELAEKKPTQFAGMLSRAVTGSFSG